VLGWTATILSSLVCRNRDTASICISVEARYGSAGNLGLGAGLEKAITMGWMYHNIDTHDHDLSRTNT